MLRLPNTFESIDIPQTWKKKRPHLQIYSLGIEQSLWICNWKGCIFWADRLSMGVLLLYRDECKYADYRKKKKGGNFFDRIPFLWSQQRERKHRGGEQKTHRHWRRPILVNVSSFLGSTRLYTRQKGYILQPCLLWHETHRRGGGELRG